MDPDKIYLAKVIQGLMDAADKLREGLSGAQQARDNGLFSKIYKHQIELWDLASALIKDKTNGNDQAGKV